MNCKRFFSVFLHQHGFDGACRQTEGGFHLDDRNNSGGIREAQNNSTVESKTGQTAHSTAKLKVGVDGQLLRSINDERVAVKMCCMIDEK